MTIRLIGVAVLAACVPIPVVCAAEADLDDAAVERMWKSGRTLPLSVSARHPLPKMRLRADTGVNVLVDLAHQCAFATLWSLPGALSRSGFRAVGSQATLDTVLTEGKPCRVRIPVGKRWPFAWWPVSRLNVLITYQGSLRSQEYLPAEREAVKAFVEAGGGLIVIGTRPPSEGAAAAWSLNALAARFGGRFSHRTDKLGGRNVTTLKLDGDWNVLDKGAAGLPVRARRTVGKGRVVLLDSLAAVLPGRNDEAKQKDLKTRHLVELVKWAAGGTKPVGGEPRLPTAMAGGGGIYPELTQRVGNMVVFYARNQKEHLLKTVREDLPAVGKQLQAWLPSKVTPVPMFLVLSAGGGGGWAVNAYEPKEVGVISLDGLGVISVFAHELAHTMGGPPNGKGRIAGQSPHHNQGEAHAGWFQGKIVAQRTKSGKPVKNCNSLFRFDKDGRSLDLAAGEGANNKKWGKGRHWTKLWWIFQTLDDRYGTTWYPRWRWVQHMRWRDDPGHRVSWDEMVEEMSIAVGEDLFPFFRAIGTTLNRQRLERTTFLGKAIDLPVAPLKVAPAGPARLDPIGDYKKPIKPRPTPHPREEDRT